MTDENQQAHIQVEYDLEFWGGEYYGTGELVCVPLALVDQLGSVEAAFQKHTGIDPSHIVFYSEDELVDEQGEPIEE